MRTEITIEAEDGNYIGIVEDIDYSVDTGPRNQAVQTKAIHVELDGPLLKS